MRPFLRWAGGKRWLVNSGKITFPSCRRFVEPFLGSGAIFFSQDTELAILSDLNGFLINAFAWMKSSPLEMHSLIEEHFRQHSIEHYYQTRREMDHHSLADAAAFIYLNRSCFNGLFRVNLAGKFNVPIGTKAYPLADRTEFFGWSDRLKGATIIRSDFEDVINQCGDGDLLFIDPPYTVAHNSNGFIEYNEKIFSWGDQIRLADALARAKSRGAEFLLTNADHDSVRALYPEEIKFSETRGSEMASRSVHRGLTTELIVASSPHIFRK